MATQVKTRIETSKTRLRRGALAYLGLYGLAYDRFQMRREQAKDLTNTLFTDLTEKGEITVKQAEVLIKQAQKGAIKNYADDAEKAVDAVPFKVKTKVERLEDELEGLQKTLDRMAKVKKPATKAKKKPAVKKASPKTAAKPKVEAKPVAAKKAEVKAVETPEATASVAPKVPTPITPRHIPYFLDVKRYDPLANEDTVRKIVNHCGIALRSEDARFVACSDESERVTVRDSWLKRKLGLTASDADMDKKVLEVCTLMQRDQKKNRVTFYYLLAKKERLLETL